MFRQSTSSLPTVSLIVHSDYRVKLLCWIKQFAIFTCGLQSYFLRTSLSDHPHQNLLQIRLLTKVFISTHFPSWRCDKGHTSRWVKLIPVKAGIDTNVFKPHSTRAASVAVRSTDRPLQTAGLSGDNFCSKPVLLGSSR